MAKTNTEYKKECLINFIVDKMKWSGDSLDDIRNTKKKIEKFSYRKLKEWAIINDFIDY